MHRARELLRLNLPGLLALPLILAFSTNWAVFRPLKTEGTVGFWLVVGAPGAVLLVVLQLAVWSHAWNTARDRREG